MDLRHLTDKSLLEDIKRLASQERTQCVLILHHLIEIEKRKLYSSLKYQSLYAYCIKELHYSEGTTHRRIVASRLLSEIPEIEERIVSGALNFMNISMAAKFIRESQIEDKAKKREILSQIEHLSKKECEDRLYEIIGREKPEVTSLTIRNETLHLLQKTRELLGGFLNNDELLTKLALDGIKKIEREKFKQVTPKKTPPPPVEVSGRYVTSEIKRRTYQRDQKCINCGSTVNLNYEHAEAYALGGSNEPENIRLMCFNCNQRKRIEEKL